ncbi:AraC family transcriptional regulator [Rhizobium sp. BK251]|uniref:AraC family transcriptional regulator n=1 Tax=Rhizobium sp. BK251 TaxID=2512125 RepID=UPI00104C6EC4|nr:AraC family transcriptional regulator [Rhizobium sp. BK251]TCL69665.1 AraC-like DNA-binding protein [Rhizobium sp. BK251]
MVHVIDTEFVPPSKRTQYLNDIVERSPLPLIHFSRASLQHSDFRARFSGRMLGDAFITRLHANAVQLRRASPEISRRPAGTILLALLHRGSYEQTFDYQSPFPNTEPGDFLLIDLDAPQTVTFTNSALTTCAYIPRSYFTPFIGDASFMRPVLVQPQDELYGLLVACFRACVALRNPSPTAAEAALKTLAHAALMAHGLNPEEHDDLQVSLVEARRLTAEQFIASHFDDPRLSAEVVAAHLGVSIRSLHLAFAGTGEGVAARTATIRLAKAKEMLLGCPERSTLDVAISCGFNNLSTFYRRFSEAYGMAPGEFRKTVAPLQSRTASRNKRGGHADLPAHES